MKHINRWRATLGTIVVVALVLLAATSCSLFENPDLPLDGTYELVGTYGTETWTFDEDSISYDGGYNSYEADIIWVVLNAFNSGDTSITTSSSSPSGDYGYVVMQYTEVSDAGTGEVGKYNVFRWQENAGDNSLMDFTQGYKAADETYANDLFDADHEARDEANNDNGYFSYASEGASKKIL